MPADTRPADPHAIAAACGHHDALLLPIPGGHSADLWRLHHPITQEPLPIVIKCTRGLSTKIRAEADALTYLNTHDLPLIPTLLHADRDAGGIALSWLHPRCLTLDDWLLHHAPTPEAIAHVAAQLGIWCATLHDTHVEPGPIKLSADPMPWPERLIELATRPIAALTKRARRDTSLTKHLDLATHQLDQLRRDVTALQHLIPDHPRQMTHRDLRPPNILVAPDDEARWQLVGVCDFERAAATQPAWDLVKLDWWGFEPHPALRAPLLHAYQTIRPLPDPSLVRLYARFEALGLLTTFAGKHPHYPQEAIARLHALDTPAPTPHPP